MGHVGHVSWRRLSLPGGAGHTGDYLAWRVTSKLQGVALKTFQRRLHLPGCLHSPAPFFTGASADDNLFPANVITHQLLCVSQQETAL